MQTTSGELPSGPVEQEREEETRSALGRRSLAAEGGWERTARSRRLSRGVSLPEQHSGPKRSKGGGRHPGQGGTCS